MTGPYAPMGTSRLMQCATMLLACCSVQSAIAAGIELRGIHLGDSCRLVIDHERELNSRPMGSVEWQAQGGNLGFEDAGAPNQHKRIGYHCNGHGLVDSYWIRAVIHGNEQALAEYASLKAGYIVRFGAADNDSDQADPAAAKHLRIMHAAASARWRSIDAESLELTLLAPLAGDEWPLSVSVRKAPK